MLPDAVEPPPQAAKSPRTAEVIRHWQRLKTPAATDHGAQRWRRVFISLGRSLCSRAAAMVCSLVMIPIALRYLGAERYGIWVTLTSFASMLSFFDFGIGVGLQNRVAEMMGTGKLERSAWCLRSTLVVLMGISAVLFAVLTLTILNTDVSAHFFRLSSIDQSELKIALLIIVGAYVLCLPFGLFSRMAFGLQQGWIASVAAASVTALTLVAVGIASQLQVPFTTFVILTVAASVLGQAASCFLVARHLPGGLTLLGPFSVAEGVRTLQHGYRYVLPTVGGVIMNQSPLVLLGTLSSPLNAAIYSVFVRISQPLLQLQQMFLDQVWPALTEAVHRGDGPWLRATLRKLLSLNSVFSALAAVAVFLAVHFLFPILTKTTDLEPTLPVVLLYALQVGVMCALIGFTYIANGLVRLRIQNFFALVCIAYVATVLPFSTINFGVEGLLLALLVLNCAVAVPVYYTDYIRYVQRDLEQFCENPSAQASSADLP